MPLGPIQGWNTVCRAIFHDSRCCERARVMDGASPNWAAYRAANSSRSQKPLESAHALICSVLPPASNCLLTAHSRPQAANLQHRAVHRRRTNWRALSPAFAQEGDLFTIQTSTRRKRALNAWGFNACGALGNKHCRKNTGKLRPDQIKGAIDRNYRIANRWWAYRADNRRRCGSRAPH
jgi:hypothetical protein